MRCAGCGREITGFERRCPYCDEQVRTGYNKEKYDYSKWDVTNQESFNESGQKGNKADYDISEYDKIHKYTTEKTTGTFTGTHAGNPTESLSQQVDVPENHRSSKSKKTKSKKTKRIKTIAVLSVITIAVVVLIIGLLNYMKKSKAMAMLGTYVYYTVEGTLVEYEEERGTSRIVKEFDLKEYENMDLNDFRVEYSSEKNRIIFG